MLKQKVRTVGRMVLMAALLGVGVYVAVYEPDALMLPVKMLSGEGGWVKRVGVAELRVGDRCVEYDVYQGSARFSSSQLMNGLFLEANGEIGMPHGEIVSSLIARPDVLIRPCNVRRIPFRLGYEPMSCFGGIQIENDGKMSDVINNLSIRENDGCCEYSFDFYWYEGDSVELRRYAKKCVLRVPLGLYSTASRVQTGDSRE